MCDVPDDVPPEKYHENAGLNPIRHWEDTAEVRMELCHIVRGSTPADRVQFLEQLVDGKKKPMTKQDLDYAVFFNKVAEAFGFVDIIDISTEGCSIVRGAQEPLRKVFSDDYQFGD
ncbi:hypothetical protein EV191_1024 [Tamaricihabitans halophyticus]|uniref:Uncharacterized protein n=1 Tax=Tamaricihabitans halophyticus TaxID=1262583 RepID=A0A4R2QYN0_9PSEU|nr:hypothetical protein [Tamaricihabitans halophyticus]TCP54797.1 hypothetical protein EV191_1024 [Tamaricihabitans halophyticus]